MPVLLLFKGQPGSGKSTLARAVATHLQWPLIDKDDARNAFQSLAAVHPEIDWNSLSYSVMFNYAQQQLNCGLSVVVDCPLARLELFQRASELAEQSGARILLVECVAQDAEMWKQRVEARGQQDAGTSRCHKPGSWEAIQAIASRDGNTSWNKTVHGLQQTLVDTTSSPLEQQLVQVLNFVREVAADNPPS